MDLQRIWTNPISFSLTHIWIISTHGFTSECPRPIKSPSKWPARTPSSAIRRWRVSISASIPPTAKFPAAWQTTWMIKIRTVTMIYISVVYRRTRIGTSCISWKQKNQWSLAISHPCSSQGKKVKLSKYKTTMVAEGLWPWNSKMTYRTEFARMVTITWGIFLPYVAESKNMWKCKKFRRYLRLLLLPKQVVHITNEYN